MLWKSSAQRIWQNRLMFPQSLKITLYLFINIKFCVWLFTKFALSNFHPLQSCQTWLALNVL
jgi:hypothetical protein